MKEGPTMDSNDNTTATTGLNGYNFEYLTEADNNGFSRPGDSQFPHGFEPQRDGPLQLQQQLQMHHQYLNSDQQFNAQYAPLNHRHQSNNQQMFYGAQGSSWQPNMFDDGSQYVHDDSDLQESFNHHPMASSQLNNSMNDMGQEYYQRDYSLNFADSKSSHHEDMNHHHSHIPPFLSAAVMNYRDDTGKDEPPTKKLKMSTNQDSSLGQGESGAGSRRQAAVEALLTTEVRKLLYSKPTSKLMKIRASSLFATYSGMNPTLALRFQDLILAVNKDNWGKYTPDEIEVACTVAVKYGSLHFWNNCKDNLLLLARIRNWMAQLVKLKKHDDMPYCLQALIKLPKTLDQLEKSKLIPVLNILSKRGNPNTYQLAGKVLATALDNPKSESPEPKLEPSTNNNIDQNRSKSLPKSSSSSIVAKIPPSASSSSSSSSTSSSKSVVNDDIIEITAVNREPIDKSSENGDKSKLQQIKPKAPPPVKKVVPPSAPAPTGNSGFFKHLQSAQTVVQKPVAPKIQKPVSTDTIRPKAPNTDKQEAGKEEIKPDNSNAATKQTSMVVADKEVENKEAKKPSAPSKLFSSTLSFKTHMASLRKPAKPAEVPITKEEIALTTVKKKRKSVKWRDENLVETRIFEPYLDAEAHHLRGLAEAKKMEYHEALLAFRNTDPETDEGLDWYEPAELQVIDLDKRVKTANSIKRGGNKVPDSKEAGIQKEREAHALVVYYSAEEEIPPCPSEADVDTNQSQTTEPKKIPLAADLEKHPLVRYLFKNAAETTLATAQDANTTDLLAIVQSLQMNNQPAPTNQYQLPIPSSAPIQAQRFIPMLGTPNLQNTLATNDATAQVAQLNNFGLPATPGAYPNLEALTNILKGLPQQKPVESDVSTVVSEAPRTFDTILTDRKKDVREFVRNEIANSENYRQHCRFFKTGKCRKGDACPYLHTGE